MNEISEKKTARRERAYDKRADYNRDRNAAGRHDHPLESIIGRLPDDIARTLRMMPESMSSRLEEIRFRTGRPVMVYAGGREYEMYRRDNQNLSPEELEKIFRLLVHHSVYSYQEDIRSGFVTLDGGHRVGICGRAVTDGSGHVVSIKNISSINIRRGREVIGSSDGILPYLAEGGKGVKNTIIVSPPKCGKTTVLRDLIRNLSNMGYKVGVCDERCEIAGACGGRYGFDLGLRTDVVDSCPKDAGILMLIRSMSPDVVAVDEIGTEADARAIERACVSGVSVVAAMHGDSFEDVLRSPIGKFVKSGVIRRLVFLTDSPAPGTVSDVRNASGMSLLKPQEMRWDLEKEGRRGTGEAAGRGGSGEGRQSAAGRSGKDDGRAGGGSDKGRQSVADRNWKDDGSVGGGSDKGRQSVADRNWKDDGSVGGGKGEGRSIIVREIRREDGIEIGSGSRMGEKTVEAVGKMESEIAGEGTGGFDGGREK